MNALKQVMLRALPYVQLLRATLLSPLLRLEKQLMQHLQHSYDTNAVTVPSAHYAQLQHFPG